MKFNRQKDLTAFLNVPGRPAIDQTCLLALCFLSSFDKPRCTYTVPQLSRLCGLSVRTVYRALASLENSGTILRESHHDHSACTFNLRVSVDVPLSLVPSENSWASHFRQDAGIWSCRSEWALRAAPRDVVARYEFENSVSGLSRIPVAPDLFAAQA
jgi:hypothetical protein